MQTEADDPHELIGIQAGATHEGTVNISLGHDGGDVIGLH
jgi:hypothetical protein